VARIEGKLAAVAANVERVHAQAVSTDFAEE
jgi:hypothetical protein